MATSAHSLPGGPATSDLDPAPTPHIVATQIRMTLTPSPDVSAKPGTQLRFLINRNGKVFLYVCHMWSFPAQTEDSVSAEQLVRHGTI